MSRELFRQVVEGRPSAPAGPLSALPVSVLVHVVVVVALVVIPLIANTDLPFVRVTDIIWTPVVLPPTPPPAPSPAIRRTAPSAVVDAGAAPVVPPEGIGRERLIASDTPLDVSAPEVGGSVPGVGLPDGVGTVVGDAPPPIRAVTPVRPGALVKAPVKIRDVSPVYPETAIIAKVEGLVIIEAVIGPTGDVQEARILRSHPLLDQAALTAVRQWKYTPTLLRGVPVPVIMTVTVNFTLR